MASTDDAAHEAAKVEFGQVVINVAEAARGASVDIRVLISDLLRQGMSPADVKLALIKDLREGGRIFGPLKKAIRETTGRTVGTTMDNVQRAAYDARLERLKKAFDEGLITKADDLPKMTPEEVFATGPDALETWITVQDGKECPDCRPRHNLTMTRAEWAEIGRPRWGMTICGPHCRCRLIPAAAAIKDGGVHPELVEPVDVPRAAAAQPPAMQAGEKP